MPPRVVSVRVEGFPRVQTRLRRLGANRKMVNVGLDAAAIVIARRARRLVPVDTGRLKRSIRIDPARGRKPAWVRAGYERRQPNYARFVHDGTRHVRGRPFLTNAQLQTRRQQLSAFTRAARRELRRFLRRR